MRSRPEQHVPGDPVQGRHPAAFLLLQEPLPQRALRPEQLPLLRQQVRLRAAVLQRQVHGGGLRRQQLRPVRNGVPSRATVRVRELRVCLSRSSSRERGRTVLSYRL
ncbi:hypothetical protein GW17_00006553 [Ensete ventricosum]|nr:hypothetical protein GW17_00006553 [Ensete ventricosum]